MERGAARRHRRRNRRQRQPHRAEEKERRGQRQPRRDHGLPSAWMPGATSKLAGAKHGCWPAMPRVWRCCGGRPA